MPLLLVQDFLLCKAPFLFDVSPSFLLPFPPTPRGAFSPVLDIFLGASVSSLKMLFCVYLQFT